MALYKVIKSSKLCQASEGPEPFPSPFPDLWPSRRRLTMLAILTPHQLVIITYHLPVRLKIEHLRPLVLSCSIHLDLHSTQLLQVDFTCDEFLFLARTRSS
jgi:hypothetical protein